MVYRYVEVLGKDRESVGGWVAVVVLVVVNGLPALLAYELSKSGLGKPMSLPQCFQPSPRKSPGRISFPHTRQYTI